MNYLGILFITLGLLINQWTLGYFFAADGQIALLSDRIFIWIFQFWSLFFGVFIFSERASLNKKRFAFSVMMIVFIFITIEAGLHTLHFFIDTDPKKEAKLRDKRYSLSPYKNNEWGAILLDEFHEIFDEKSDEEISKGYHGKYLNVDSQGVRKTWNPSNSYGKRVRTIYAFGGSTLWGDGARDDYTIPSFLSKLLYQRDSNFIVYNHGQPGWDFKQEINHLISLLEKGERPDFVIFYDGFNDVSQFTQSEGVEKISNILGSITTLKDRFQNYSMIYTAVMNTASYFSREEDLLISAVSQYDDQKINEFTEEFVKDYLKSIYTLDVLSKTFGFKFLCFWQPVTFTEERLTEEELRTIDLSLNNRVFGKLFKQINKILSGKPPPHFFNLSNTLKDRKILYYTDWCHLTEEGNEVVATRMAEIFERKFLNEH